MIKVGIVGASGYSGMELIRILMGHPDVEISFITSEKNAGKALSSILPSFNKILDLDFVSINQGLKLPCDLAFVALPHKTAMSVVPFLLENCGKVIEFQEKALRKVEGKLTKKYDFLVKGHKLEVSGYCPKCKVHI